jgi:hypothetical protein
VFRFSEFGKKNGFKRRFAPNPRTRVKRLAPWENRNTSPQQKEKVSRHTVLQTADFTTRTHRAKSASR